MLHKQIDAGKKESIIKGLLISKITENHLIKQYFY